VKTERQLGDLWAETREADGAWIVKLPSSALAGLPDWCLMLGTLQLWEAKRIQEGRVAYCPDQLSGAQRFFQRMIGRYAPECGGVLVLAEEGFVEIPARKALRPMSLSTFNRRMEPYRE
jgi:hypothetical protein